MKLLILGLGQDAKLLAIACKSLDVEFFIVTRHSEHAAEFIAKHAVPTDRVRIVDSITERLLKEVRDEFNFSCIVNTIANSFVHISGSSYWDYLKSNTKLLCDLISFCEMNHSTILVHFLSAEIYNSNYEISPRNAYGVSKSAEYLICKDALAKGLPIIAPVFFNHESSLRSASFFSRKLLLAITERIDVDIYNCESIRDWGFAPEYMSILLDTIKEENFGISDFGTGVGLTVREFIDYALNESGVAAAISSSADGLLTWDCGDFTINELERDRQDSERVVLARVDLMREVYGRVPELCGREVVEHLANELR